MIPKEMKYNVCPCKPQFYYIKVGFKGVNIIKACFRDALNTTIRQPAGQNMYKGPERTARRPHKQ